MAPESGLGHSGLAAGAEIAVKAVERRLSIATTGAKFILSKKSLSPSVVFGEYLACRRFKCNYRASMAFRRFCGFTTDRTHMHSYGY